MVEPHALFTNDYNPPKCGELMLHNIELFWRLFEFRLLVGRIVASGNRGWWSPGVGRWAAYSGTRSLAVGLAAFRLGRWWLGPPRLLGRRRGRCTFLARRHRGRRCHDLRYALRARRCLRHCRLREGSTRHHAERRGAGRQKSRHVVPFAVMSPAQMRRRGRPDDGGCEPQPRCCNLNAPPGERFRCDPTSVPS